MVTITGQRQYIIYNTFSFFEELLQSADDRAGLHKGTTNTG
jgi:hypothetical protein